LNATDNDILAVAQKLFLEQGILNTEMRDIANKAGCSRSTLYRHFGSKEAILVHLVEKALDTFTVAVKIPKELKFENGFDALNWQMHRFAESLIEHVDEITFIRDFDCVFTNRNPTGEEAEDYLRRISSLNSANWWSWLLYDSLHKGILDGSIRPVEDEKLLLATLSHSCLGIAERIMPREAQNISEHGYGREMVRMLCSMMMDSLKNDEKV
jgi:AcrR family transcriptional regulator